jgi:hypothetical protein
LRQLYKLRATKSFVYIEAINTSLVKMTETLPLALKKDLRDNEENLKKHLQEIKNITGVEFTVEISPSMGEINNKIDGSYKNRLGEIVYNSLMGEVAALFKKNSADSMVKDALIEATPAKKIIFEMTDSASSYHDIVFSNGSLVIKFKPQNIWTNISDIGYSDVVPLL